MEFSAEHECETCRAKPGAPELCALCLQRRALKVGDLVKDPELMKAGFRFSSGFWDWVVTGRSADDSGWLADSQDGSVLGTSASDGFTRNVGRHFLGWAGETEMVKPRDKPATPPPICDAERCEVHHDPGDPACIRAKHRTPPRALPFKRHPDCSGAMHGQAHLCLECERLIGKATAGLPIINGHSLGELIEAGLGQPAEPSLTGLGATVGPVLSRLR